MESGGPAIPLAGLYPRKHNTEVYAETQAGMLPAALFTTAPTWK